jgi:hypothetical protein
MACFLDILSERRILKFSTKWEGEPMVQIPNDSGDGDGDDGGTTGNGAGDESSMMVSLMMVSDIGSLPLGEC